MLKLVVHPVRKIALALRHKLEKELQDMVDQGIISSVGDGESDWVNLLVIREKPDGRLHISLDPSDLNKVIKREHHPVPTVHDITPRLHRSHTILQTGYCIVLLECSTYQGITSLEMFNMHKGRYKFLRMPFGCNRVPR